MIRAALISLGLALPAAAQPVACAFTILCAPEIECEAHEGIPFEIDWRDGTHWVEIDGEEAAGMVLAPPPDLALSFVTEGETLLFTMTEGGDGALTRHRQAPTGRLTVATFLGRCVTA
ncbi:MAG: hypothetical protein ACOCYW_03250 [Roseicyclus sp.]